MEQFEEELKEYFGRLKIRGETKNLVQKSGLRRENWKNRSSDEGVVLRFKRVQNFYRTV